MALSKSCQSDCKCPSPGSWKPGVVPCEKSAWQILQRGSGSEDEQISILRGGTSGMSCEIIIFPSVVLLFIQYVLWLGTMQVFHVGERFCHIYLHLETINLGGCFYRSMGFFLYWFSNALGFEFKGFVNVHAKHFWLTSCQTNEMTSAYCIICWSKSIFRSASLLIFFIKLSSKSCSR